MVLMLICLLCRRRKPPKRFANKRIQQLFDFSNRHFSEEFYREWKSGMDKTFGTLIVRISHEDWNYFEENIHLWDSLNLFFMAECLMMDPVFYRTEYAYVQRVYWLAFLHCEAEEARNLAVDLEGDLSLSVAVDSDLLEQVRDRLSALQYNQTN